MRVWTAILFSLFPFGFVAAQADVTFEIAFPDGRTVLPGQAIEAEIAMINLGPGVADGVAVGTGWPITNGFRTFSVFPTARTSPCSLSYMEFVDPFGGISTETVTVFPTVAGGGTVAPGGQVTCVVGIPVAPEAPAENTAFFSVGAFTPDPNASNNTISVEIISGAAPAIAVPALQLGWLVVLVSLIGFASGFYFRGWFYD